MTGSSAPVTSALVGLIGFAILFAAGVFLLRWLQKRMGQPLGAGQSDVRVLRRFPLGWQCMLLVVEVAGKQYILTTSRNGGVTLIDEVAQPLDTSAPHGDFGQRLIQAVRKRRGDG